MTMAKDNTKRHTGISRGPIIQSFSLSEENIYKEHWNKSTLEDFSNVEKNNVDNNKPKTKVIKMYRGWDVVRNEK